MISDFRKSFNSNLRKQDFYPYDRQVCSPWQERPLRFGVGLQTKPKSIFGFAFLVCWNCLISYYYSPQRIVTFMWPAAYAYVELITCICCHFVNCQNHRFFLTVKSHKFLWWLCGELNIEVDISFGNLISEKKIEPKIMRAQTFHNRSKNKIFGTHQKTNQVNKPAR